MMVCAKCNRALRPKQNGVPFLEMCGGAENRPYRLWMADLWECQECGAKILYIDAKQTPIARNFDANFQDKINSYAPIFFSKEWSRPCKHPKYIPGDLECNHCRMSGANIEKERRQVLP